MDERQRKVPPQSDPFWRIARARIKHAIFSRASFLSQAGQDLWVFGEAFNEMVGGFFVDVGAHDGVTFSNTYLLEHRYRWRGICIEANPKSFAILAANRNVACLNICLDAQEGYVEFVTKGPTSGIVAPDTDNKQAMAHEQITMKAATLRSVLERQNAPEVIDYLSIDVEGAEERILGSFPFDKYTFNCVTVERPSKVLRSLLASQRFLLIKEIPGLDCFYVHARFLAEYRKNLFAFYSKRRYWLRWR